MSPQSQDTVLVWMLSLNREYTKEEYDVIYRLQQVAFPNDKQEYKLSNADSFRNLMTQLLPLLMMRHRRVPRAKWVDHITPNGKHWIEHAPDMSNRPRPPSIGYQLTYHNSLCGMAVTQGLPTQVVNIGLGIKQLRVEPRNTTVPVYFESMSHKLTELEVNNISNNPDDLILKRLCILLALKESYIKAIGQPIGFDFSRLEFDVPNRKATGDGKPLIGWEFRVFGAKLGVGRKDILKQEEYECVCAYYRGNQEVSYIFHETTQQLESWVQFINIDQLMAVAPKLSA